MNENNFDYLKDQVKFTGFGESLEDTLREKIEEAKPEFKIQFDKEFGKDQANATLHFKKGEQSDLYFFNSYDLSVKQDGVKEPVNQTFYIGKENNFTLKEAFNLLSGRAVHKELNKLEKIGEGESAQYKPTDEKYNTWVQLDFKNADDNGNFKMKYFHENYGYDLNAELAKHPIKELANDSELKSLVQSLQKGNRQSVTFMVGETEQKRSIEAVPQWKSINIYDASNKRIRTDLKQDENSENEKKAQKQTNSQKAGDGGAEEKDGKKRSRRKGQSM